jgi:hypothetical protein
MAREPDHLRTLIEKLDRLSPNRIAEVEDFVDFLSQRGQDRELVQNAAGASEPSFAKVWENTDDAAYDRL